MRLNYINNIINMGHAGNKSNVRGGAAIAEQRVAEAVDKMLLEV